MPKKTTSPKAAKPATKKTVVPKAEAGPPAAAPKRVSALGAAHQVLAAEGRPMTARELIEAMATQGLWTSPGGKTPANTLYAALLREIAVKGEASRFSRPEPGKFATR